MAPSKDLMIIEPQDMTSQVRNRLEPTNRGLRLVNPTGKTADDYQEGFEKNPRLRYAAMRAHQEMAAQALAVGATQKMAARYAGVSPRQIKKYWTDPEFRSRIDELRGLLASRIKGKILRELNRRTSGQDLKDMDLLDMLRVFDRVTVGGKGMAITVEGDVNVNNRYENILAALFRPDSGTDGGDFPGYGPEDLSLPSGNSPVDG